MKKAFVKMALRGAAVSKTKSEWIWPDPYCDAPVNVRMSRSAHRDGGISREVEIRAPCRKCQKCLQFRQMRWAERCRAEIALAPRTWFVTLTFSPTHLAGVMAEARRTEKPWSFSARVERAAYRHVQRYLKRVRKVSGKRFRYFAAYERGDETGRSHYHLFIHEVNGPIGNRTLKSQWRSHVDATLVRESDIAKNVRYLTTYATKSSDVRLKASTRYGTGLSKKPPVSDRKLRSVL